jgi:hypothetical protein
LDDGAESVAGTDPRSASSVLRVSGLALPEEGWVVTWASATGRIYSLSLSTNGVEDFRPLVTGLLAAPPANAWTVAPPAAAQFFLRVQTEP